MFIDRVKMKLKAGNGGNGLVAFRRENMYPWEDRQEGMAATAAILFLKLTATSQPYWICAIPSS